MSGFVTRQPLVLRAALVLILVGLVRLGVWAGWLPAEWATAGPVDAERIIDAIVMALGWWSTHRAVTPVAEPRDSLGRELVPVNAHPFDR